MGNRPKAGWPSPPFSGSHSLQAPTGSPLSSDILSRWTLLQLYWSQNGPNSTPFWKCLISFYSPSCVGGLSFPRLTPPLTSGMNTAHSLPHPHYFLSLIRSHSSSFPSRHHSVPPAKCQACSHVGMFLLPAHLHHSFPHPLSSSLLNFTRTRMSSLHH